MASNNASENQESDSIYPGYETDKSLLNHHHHNHHDHDHHSHEHEKSEGCIKSKSKRLVAMLIMVFSFFLVEALVGQITHSLTLLADSFHMLSDALALVVALVAVTYSKRRSNEALKPWFSRNRYSNTFGWVRFEVVGALVNATFLLALCLSIAMEAVEKFMKPELPSDPHLVLIVGASGLVVNLLGLWLFGGHVGHNHDHGNKSNNEEETDGKKSKHKEVRSHSHSHDQMNMRAVFLHVLGDALGSVVVVITALMYIFIPHKREHTESIQLTTTSIYPSSENATCSCVNTEEEQVTLNRWILFIDPAMSLILVIILCVTTIPLFKQSGFILMQSVPVHIDIEDLKSKISNVPGICFIHEFHVWQLAGEKLIATIHIQVKDSETYQRVAGELKTKLCGVGIHSLTVQPEFQLTQSRGCYTDCNSTECDRNGACPSSLANENETPVNKPLDTVCKPSSSTPNHDSEDIQLSIRQNDINSAQQLSRRDSGDSPV